MALFFTRGVSLGLWYRSGLLAREKLLYEAYLDRGILSKVFWLTYGHGDCRLGEELKSAGRLHPGIEIIEMPRIFGDSPPWHWLYSFCMPFMHSRALKTADIMKTNQIDGSQAAFVSKLLWKKPLLLRAGYALTKLEKDLNGGKRLRNTAYALVERAAYALADGAVITSIHEMDYLERKYRTSAGKIKVIRTFVDLERFRPLSTGSKGPGAVYVGRLSAEKNLESLIRALPLCGLDLDIYGEGPEKERLIGISKAAAASVRFMGSISNEELPPVLNRYRFFALPSVREGMPKALIEAMACGLVCIGTDVEGINEIIRDGENGFLAAGTGHIKIADALRRAARSDTRKIGREAVRTASGFSLAGYVREEACIIEELAGRHLEAAA